MVSVRHGTREFLVLTLAFLLCAALTSASWAQQAAKKGDKCEKPKATQATESTSLLQTIQSALGLSESKAAQEARKKREAAQKKAIEEARAAYERQQRELQERLRNDPLWKPSYEQVRVIKVGEYAQNHVVNSFCLNKNGKLLVCCGRKPGGESRLDPTTQSGATKEPADRGEILLFNPDGKKLGAWKMPFEPQAICAASDGTVYVGGAGKLCTLDRNGKVLLTADVPGIAKLPPLPAVAEKKADPQGQDAAAAKKAKQKEVAELQKKIQEAREEFRKVAQEAQKNLKPNDEASQEAFEEKMRKPVEKLRTLQEKLTDLTMTPEVRAARLRMAREWQLAVTGMAVTDRDLFLACKSAKGYGYVVWRTDRNFKSPKKIVENLAGCCGQMDIQANKGELWVAHNGQHKVEHYSRDGKRLSSFGRTDRTNADGFGGCCEPKNLRFAVAGEVFAAESVPPTCVKRFTTTGKFLGVMVMAPWNSGCVRVTTEFRRDLDQFFVLNSGDREIHVFAKRPPKAAAGKKTVAAPKAAESQAAQ